MKVLEMILLLQFISHSSLIIRNYKKKKWEILYIRTNIQNYAFYKQFITRYDSSSSSISNLFN